MRLQSFGPIHREVVGEDVEGVEVAAVVDAVDAGGVVEASKGRLSSSMCGLIRGLVPSRMLRDRTSKNKIIFPNLFFRKFIYI